MIVNVGTIGRVSVRVSVKMSARLSVGARMDNV